MKPLLVVMLLSGVVFCQQRPAFVDRARGYAIEYPESVSVKAGSYSTSSAADTHYVAVFYGTEEILSGDFDDMWPHHFDFRSYAVDLAIRSSTADGPDGSVFCEDIDSVRVKRNKHGVRYAEIFLQKHSEGGDGSRSEIVGPYFVIDISAAIGKRSLYLDWRPNWKPTAVQTNTARYIAEHIRLLGP